MGILFRINKLKMMGGQKQEDLYKILGITKKAEQAEIKTVFRKLALKWHPDKNDSPEAKETFQKISMAYSILVDPKKREMYDKYGVVDEQFQDGFDDFFGDMDGCGFDDFLDSFMNMDFMFNMDKMFGKGMKMGGGRGKGGKGKTGKGSRAGPGPKVSKKEEREFMKMMNTVGGGMMGGESPFDMDDMGGMEEMMGMMGGMGMGGGMGGMEDMMAQMLGGMGGMGGPDGPDPAMIQHLLGEMGMPGMGMPGMGGGKKKTAATKANTKKAANKKSDPEDEWESAGSSDEDCCEPPKLNMDEYEIANPTGDPGHIPAKKPAPKVESDSESEYESSEEEPPKGGQQMSGMRAFFEAMKSMPPKNPNHPDHPDYNKELAEKNMAEVKAGRRSKLPELERTARDLKENKEPVGVRRPIEELAEQIKAEEAAEKKAAKSKKRSLKKKDKKSGGQLGDFKPSSKVNAKKDDMLFAQMEKELHSKGGKGLGPGGVFGSNDGEYADFMDSGMEKEMGLLFKMFLREKGLPNTTFMNDKLCTEFENWLDAGIQGDPNMPDDMFAGFLGGMGMGGMGGMPGLGAPKPPAKGQANRGRKL